VVRRDHRAVDRPRLDQLQDADHLSRSDDNRYRDAGQGFRLSDRPERRD
jgi:hypothetical protein